MGESKKDLFREGYDRALDLLRRCALEEGFLATPTDNANYRRIWGRDSCMIGLAALVSGDAQLIDTCRKTLLFLAGHQGPHGEIPSNVDPDSGRISYGGTTGRVDADLWFIICCGQYWRATADHDFLKEVCPVIEKTHFLLGAWEFNTRGLLYIPATGDWADEYVQSGYVLYDNLLYLQAQRELAAIHRCKHGGVDHALQDNVSRLRHLIRANYWFNDSDDIPEDVYHEILYQRSRRAAEHQCGRHWLPFFSPATYGYRYDAFANVLASLFDVADDAQRAEVDQFVARQALVPEDMPLLPAFHPVITPKDEAWDDLQMSFSHTFKNEPYEFQNGGLWPMITGFHVADLARRDRPDDARRFLEGIHRANASEVDGQPWSFPEYLHGRKLTPGGNAFMGWSAAAAVFGRHALEGTPIFRTNIPEHPSTEDTSVSEQRAATHA